MAAISVHWLPSAARSTSHTPSSRLASRSKESVELTVKVDAWAGSAESSKQAANIATNMAKVLTALRVEIPYCTLMSPLMGRGSLLTRFDVTAVPYCLSSGGASLKCTIFETLCTMTQLTFLGKVSTS